jgi:hypothetical protein
VWLFVTGALLWPIGSKSVVSKRIEVKCDLDGIGIHRRWDKNVVSGS